MKARIAKKIRRAYPSTKQHRVYFGQLYFDYKPKKERFVYYDAEVPIDGIPGLTAVEAFYLKYVFVGGWLR